MLDRLAAFIVGEGNWLPIAMSVATIFAAAALRKHGRLAAMNLFVGVMLLVMGGGHLLAVSTKLMQGTLNGSPAWLYLIGVVIVVPASLHLQRMDGGRRDRARPGEHPARDSGAPQHRVLQAHSASHWANRHRYLGIHHRWPLHRRDDVHAQRRQDV
jgi:hypothetical protein